MNIEGTAVIVDSIEPSEVNDWISYFTVINGKRPDKLILFKDICEQLNGLFFQAASGAPSLFGIPVEQINHNSMRHTSKQGELEHLLIENSMLKSVLRVFRDRIRAAEEDEQPEPYVFPSDADIEAMPDGLEKMIIKSHKAQAANLADAARELYIQMAEKSVKWENTP